MGARLADYVINESGFGADLGAEKYFNLAMRSSGLKPAVAVVIATAKALTAHGAPSDPAAPHDLAALDRGLANLAKHLDSLSKFHVPVVVAINRFPADTNAEIKLIEQYCHSREIGCAIVEAYEKGGEGAMELASIVADLAEGGPSSKTAPLYSLEDSLEEKIKIVATQIYGARDVSFESEARKRLRQFTDLGFGQLPICMAKTPASLTDQPHLLGAPHDWTLTITGAHLSAGAGFVVPIAGSMMLMPGLPRVSQATRLDVNDDGLITGMNY
jgi:formate--tetrahydrofolate ligase